MILAGDVGGTKSNLAIFEEKGGRLAAVVQRRYASHEHATFEGMITRFLQETEGARGGKRVKVAGFGVAGPVVENRVHATNLPWIVDGREVRQAFGFERVVLLNDLEATGHSLEHLREDEMLVLNQGNPQPGGTRALLAAGTGHGQALLVWNGKGYRVAPSEGGHSDFAPRTEQQIELLRFMRKRTRHVTWELILSGRGFRTLHEFLNPAVVHESFAEPGDAAAPEITRRGLERSCPVCVEALDLWTAMYGAEAGNLALKVLALGGVYVAGGIAVKIIEKIKDGTFLRNFCDREEKFEELMRNIPLTVVLNEEAPLLGAAWQAMETSGG